MKRKTIIPLIVGFILLVAVLAAVCSLMQKSDNTEATRIYVYPSTTYASLRQTLRDEGIVTGNALFGFYEAIIGHEVKPGSYLIDPHSTILSIVQKLRYGQQDPIRLTIPKMRTAEQVNAFLCKHLMHDDFAIDSNQLCIIHPNTYEVYWSVSPENFLHRMSREDDAFWRARGVADTANCGTLRLSRRDVTILASIIDEETNHNPEKATIASVYLNRLAKGIPLQADPTVKYAVGDFGLRRILNTHLQANSPYNTYLHTGLPPTPICLASASSIDAVLHAAKTNYLYFCASDAMDGTHLFASSLAEHNRNAARFHAALNKRGIR